MFTALQKRKCCPRHVRVLPIPRARKRNVRLAKGSWKKPGALPCSKKRENLKQPVSCKSIFLRFHFSLLSANRSRTVCLLCSFHKAFSFISGRVLLTLMLTLICLLFIQWKYASEVEEKWHGCKWTRFVKSSPRIQRCSEVTGYL